MTSDNVPHRPIGRTAEGPTPCVAPPAPIGHHLRMRGIRFLLVLTLSTAACDGCGPRPLDDEDGGAPPGDGFDAGPRDAGFQDAGEAEGLDAGGSDDAGVYDAGFSWTDVLGDGGLPPELACLPGTTPEASITGLIAALELSTYSGRGEEGVVCGGTTCALGRPCCVFCGFAQCADEDGDGGYACPLLTQELVCDGNEDCPGGSDADTCCYSLSGTDCRAEDECTFELPELPSFDGGFTFPSSDGGADDDAGDADAGDDDGGEPDAGDDAGFVDAGFVDAGPLFDLAAILDQGVPVCTNSLPFFGECDVLNGELCCTSERFVAIDIGLCVPALVCIGGQLP